MINKNSSQAPTINELPIIQQGSSFLVSAILLHKKLRVKTQFSDWIKSRISKYCFEGGSDYFTEISVKLGVGRKATDYLLSNDMAKELAMLEENEIGRQIRRYFIQKENEVRGISNLPNETSLFKGLKPHRINDREMYPYREILERAGYKSSNNGDRRHKYWMHFVKEGNILFVTKEFAQHLYHQRQVFNNRKVMLASIPVLPFNFGEPLSIEGGAA